MTRRPSSGMALLEFVGMGVTEGIVVPEFGKKIAEALPAEIRENPL